MLIRFKDKHPSGISAGTVADISPETATQLIAEGKAERATKKDLEEYHAKAAKDREEAAEQYIADLLAEREAKAEAEAKAKREPKAITDVEKVLSLEATVVSLQESLAEKDEIINQLRADIALLEQALLNK